MTEFSDFTSLKFMASNQDTSTISIPLGIIIGLLASFVQSLGLTIQRKSHVQNQALPEDQQRVEHRRPLWLLGFAIFISSNLFGSLVQIASLPVVILAPLGAVSLLWNAFFARMILGDAFSLWMVLGTLLIAGGAILIAVFGVVPEPTHSLEDLLILFARPAFIVYFSMLGLVVVLCLVITHALEYSYSRRASLPAASPPLSPLLAPNTAPTLLTTVPPAPAELESASGIITERTPLIDRKASRSSSPSPTDSIRSYSLSNYISPFSSSARIPTLLAMSYASFSGIISGMCLLFAKSGVELLVLTIAGKNQFYRWQSWVLVLGLVVCALLQLWYMHKGLILANPTLICPLAFCFYNLSSIVNGLVYFDQFSLLPVSHLCLVMLGMVVLLAGVWIVSLPPSGGVGIDLHLWNEHQADAAEDEAEFHEIYEDEPLPMVPQRSSQSEWQLSSVDQPSSESTETDANVGLGPVHGGLYGSLDVQKKPHARRQTDSALPPPITPLASSSPATQPLQTPSSPVRLRHPRARATSTLPPSSSLSSHTNIQQYAPPPRQSIASTHYTYPFPLSPGATPGTLGGGFSIGLSPVSPGFALVPRKKRRRTGSAGDGLGLGLPVNDDGNSRTPGKGLARDSASIRRVASDGEVYSPFPSFSSEEERRGLLGNQDDETTRHTGLPSHTREASGEDDGKPRHAKGRWKWLGGLFSFKST